jgi:hypothetical protein
MFDKVASRISEVGLEETSSDYKNLAMDAANPPSKPVRRGAL